MLPQLAEHWLRRPARRAFVPSGGSARRALIAATVAGLALTACSSGSSNLTQDATCATYNEATLEEKLEMVHDWRKGQNMTVEGATLDDVSTLTSSDGSREVSNRQWAAPWRARFADRCAWGENLERTLSDFSWQEFGQKPTLEEVLGSSP